MNVFTLVFLFSVAYGNAEVFDSKSTRTLSYAFKGISKTAFKSENEPISIINCKMDPAVVGKTVLRNLRSENIQYKLFNLREVVSTFHQPIYLNDSGVLIFDSVNTSKTFYKNIRGAYGFHKNLQFFVLISGATFEDIVSVGAEYGSYD